MKLAITGTVGVPGKYGGFETLVQNLADHASRQPDGIRALTIYCSARAYPDRPPRYKSAQLRYSRLNANGVQSIPYDIVTALDAIWRRHDTLLVLGVSGTIVLPLVRAVSRARIIVNVDGKEWARDKWQGPARRFLRWSEKLAVKYAHAVVADNQGIADYLYSEYGIIADVIAYGGDHALLGADLPAAALPPLPDRYALALCRIEPENNVEMILEAYAKAGEPLVFVGNWDNSEFGRVLRARYADYANLSLLDPVYDPAGLFEIRRRAQSYVHGHSAGGTNPSLVEMMHFGVPVFAFDCDFNRYTTEDQARYFAHASDLSAFATSPLPDGDAMREIAKRRYTWDRIGEEYFNLLAADQN